MEKINIAEILKNCPKGMELDCLMYKNVTLLEVTDQDLYPIHIKTKSGFITKLTKFGQNIHNCDAKCVIFPKGKTTWEGFVPPCQFKDGDIVATSSGGWIGITTGGKSGEFMPTYCVITGDGEFEVYFNKKETWQFHRLATKEEKQKLFDAIKKNGYKWNAETKTLEKVINRNKFTIGAIVTNGKIKGKICSRDVDSYKLEDGTYIFFNEVHNWKLVLNKFDINSLKPFDKVLVRNTNKDYWEISMFGHISNHDKQYFMCIANSGFYQCVPYNDETKHLLDTTNDCDEFYKTW